MKNRIIMYCFLILNCVTIYAQGTPKNEIIGKEYIYALIKVQQPSCYPLVFAMITDRNDTIDIDTESLESCIYSIYENAVSAPIDAIECYDTFYRIFGKTSAIRELCDRAYMSFFDQLDKNCLSKSFTLGTGENVILQYASFIGLIANVYDQHSLSIGLNTDDYPFLQQRNIPISILECKPSKTYFNLR